MTTTELSYAELDGVAGGTKAEVFAGVLLTFAVQQVYDSGPVAWAQEQVKNAQQKQQKKQ